MKLLDKFNHISRISHIIMSILLAFVFTSGCKYLSTTPPMKRLFIVLLDETNSLAMHDENGIRYYWDEVLPLVAMVVEALEGGDEFGLIGIDEHGFDAEDVRIPITTLDDSKKKAGIQKNNIIEQVHSLEKRKIKHSSTDILGALYHAAYFASRELDHKTTIYCFSDMKREPRWPTQERAKHLRFPEGTEGYFFYVNASGRSNWKELIGIWKPILSNANLCIDSTSGGNFFQSGETPNQLKSALQNKKRGLFHRTHTQGIPPAKKMDSRAGLSVGEYVMRRSILTVCR